jgi:hypothetical protein
VVSVQIPGLKIPTERIKNLHEADAVFDQPSG